MVDADIRWGDPNMCRFPLWEFVKPMSLPWMVLLYAVLFTTAVCMCLGYRWRLTCGVFVVVYWYLFLLDKSYWNNHSYLYGLIASLLLVADSHTCYSLDGLRDSEATRPGVFPVSERRIPLWQYTLVRTQIFLLYFFAGVKKLDVDWLSGYSMRTLARHWVFHPFKYFLSEENIDLWVIHAGGCLFDLSIGFLLLFDSTRKMALVLSSAFHLMNSQIFAIGMFPWVCLATLPIFCSMSWPRPLIRKTKTIIWRERSVTREDEDNKPLHPSNRNISDLGVERQPTIKQYLTTFLVILYISVQVVLPFSHSITKGYTTWTDGPYGYSWDMMVHSWETLHVKITAVDNKSGEEFYVDPNAWVLQQRWTSHADQAIQYAKCLSSNLEEYGLHKPTIFIDVWKSLNRRIHQRIFRPDVDLARAPWSPWQQVNWVLPLATELNGWRQHLDKLQNFSDPATDKIFITDFPGFSVESYLEDDLDNITLEVMMGSVLVTLPSEYDIQVQHKFKHSTKSWEGYHLGGEPHVLSEEKLDEKHEKSFVDSEVTKTQQIRNEDQSSKKQVIANLEHPEIACGEETNEKEKSSNSLHNNIHMTLDEYDKIANVNEEDRWYNYHKEPVSETQECSHDCHKYSEPTLEEYQSKISKLKLNKGDIITLPQGVLHSITTISSVPAAYMYTFTNNSLKRNLQKCSKENIAVVNPHGTNQFTQKEKWEAVIHSPLSSRSFFNINSETCGHSPNEFDDTQYFPSFSDFIWFLTNKGKGIRKCAKLLMQAVLHLILGYDMSDDMKYDHSFSQNY
ncbi:vitamin K-dependent gamma-carboxylase-like [Oratosquilla oratoria]|uniref:vitamin K-dependent gamma-carboxylase-like n=1 Tax=Oratosquilla oratoria TaxID=337810 RepID=UPI003F771180